MEAHTSHPQYFRAGTAARLDSRTLVRTGAIAGLVAGMMMAMWQMVVGAIATEPTDVPGIASSFLPATVVLALDGM